MQNIIADIKGLKLGKGSELALQSMCNCPTSDVEASVKQCQELYQAGAQLIRLTIQGRAELEALKIIKQRLGELNIPTPLVADIHFSSELAIAAAMGIADKVRINPGNFAKEHTSARAQFSRLIKACKEYNTAIRIGINHGSLGERITTLYGNTPQAMAEAMKEWVEMCIEENFFNVVLSLKASNALVMSEAYTLLYDWMESKGRIFPLHLGVTEAGNGDMGRIKSAVGLAPLLSRGIGETIRVSLTENPSNEIEASKIIRRFYLEPRPKVELNNKAEGKVELRVDVASYDEFIIYSSLALGKGLVEKEFTDFDIKGRINENDIAPKVLENFKSNILQAARIRFDKCEYVACPGCGRTQYDLEQALDSVKEATSHLKGYIIAVMGCIVNGPGEMADADFGYVGEGKGKVSIYSGKNRIYSSIPQEEALNLLVKLIEDKE